MRIVIIESMSKVNCCYLKEVANLQQVIVKPFYVSWSKEVYYLKKLEYLELSILSSPNEDDFETIDENNFEKFR